MRDNSDCFYYFNSSCAKGDDCGFRHCKDAIGSETVCLFWKSGSCVRQNCKYRHSETPVDRSRTICYFESQPGGCQKPHCAFRHRSQHRADDKAGSGDDAAPVSPAVVRDSASNRSPDQTSAQNSEPSADPAIPVEAVSFHVAKEDESDPEDEKKQRTGGQEHAGDGIVVKSLEQIRMERLFKPGNSSEIEPHKRQCTAADEVSSSAKRVRLVRPAAHQQQQREKVRAVSLSDDLTDLLTEDCEQITASDKDDDILQEIDKIINS